MKDRISKNFHVPLNSLSAVKMAKSSIATGHMGVADWGVPGVGTRDPSIGYRVHIQEVSSGAKSKCTRSSHNMQRSFPPPPTPQKRGT